MTENWTDKYFNVAGGIGLNLSVKMGKISFIASRCRMGGMVSISKPACGAMKVILDRRDILPIMGVLKNAAVPAPELLAFVAEVTSAK